MHLIPPPPGMWRGGGGGGTSCIFKLTVGYFNVLALNNLVYNTMF